MQANNSKQRTSRTLIEDLLRNNPRERSARNSGVPVRRLAPRRDSCRAKMARLRIGSDLDSTCHQRRNRWPPAAARPRRAMSLQAHQKWSDYSGSGAAKLGTARLASSPLEVRDGRVPAKPYQNGKTTRTIVHRPLE